MKTFWEFLLQLTIITQTWPWRIEGDGQGLLLQKHNHSQTWWGSHHPTIENYDTVSIQHFKEGSNAACSRWSTLVVEQKTHPGRLRPNHYSSYGSHTNCMWWSGQSMERITRFFWVAKPYDLSLAMGTQSKTKYRSYGWTKSTVRDPVYESTQSGPIIWHDLSTH